MQVMEQALRRITYLKIEELARGLSKLRREKFIDLLAVPGMRCNASRKPPSRSTSHEVR
jgi:hypothetical protein